MSRFPKRPHPHCDPLCERCQNWQERCEAIFRASVDEAMKAFWNVMEARHPGLIAIPKGERYMVEHAIDEITEVIFDGAFDVLSVSTTSPARDGRRQLVLGLEPRG